jgi:hypothetical protein
MDQAVKIASGITPASPTRVDRNAGEMRAIGAGSSKKKRSAVTRELDQNQITGSG